MEQTHNVEASTLCPCGCGCTLPIENSARRPWVRGTATAVADARRPCRWSPSALELRL